MERARRIDFDCYVHTDPQTERGGAALRQADRRARRRPRARSHTFHWGETLIELRADAHAVAPGQPGHRARLGRRGPSSRSSRPPAPATCRAPRAAAARAGRRRRPSAARQSPGCRGRRPGHQRGGGPRARDQPAARARLRVHHRHRARSSACPTCAPATISTSTGSGSASRGAYYVKQGRARARPQRLHHALRGRAACSTAAPEGRHDEAADPRASPPTSATTAARSASSSTTHDPRRRGPGQGCASPGFPTRWRPTGCRVAQLYAGNGYGFCLGARDRRPRCWSRSSTGDMRFPIVLGSLYNGATSPPWPANGRDPEGDPDQGRPPHPDRGPGRPGEDRDRRRPGQQQLDDRQRRPTPSRSPHSATSPSRRRRQAHACRATAGVEISSPGAVSDPRRDDRAELMGQPAAKQNDQVVGIDIHIVMVPSRRAARSRRRCRTRSPGRSRAALSRT